MDSSPAEKLSFLSPPQLVSVRLVNQVDSEVWRRPEPVQMWLKHMAGLGPLFLEGVSCCIGLILLTELNLRLKFAL